MAEEQKPETAGGGEEKPAAPQAAKPAAPPAAPAKPAGPTPQPWESEMVTRLKARFGESIREASTYLGQNYLVVDSKAIHEICQALRDDEQFNMLADLTAADYPKKPERFEVIYQLYSFPRNERLRVKA